MKKIITSMVFSISLLYSTSLMSESDVILTSEMVHFLDGKAIGITAGTIKGMLQARRAIKDMWFGKQTKKGTFEGHYEFNGEKYSIRALAALESALEMEFYQKEAEYLKDKRRFALELEELETTYNRTKNQLSEVLAQARKEFEEKITPFERGLRGAKDQMLVLLTESCQKHNRSDCFLLKWVEAPNGTEMQFFHSQITTFKALDQFCSDFTHFLDDVMRSCPKAMAQFKKLMDDQHAQANARR